MKTLKKLLLVASSSFLLAGCNEKPQCPDQEQCPACEQCETCKECEECPTPHEHSFDTKWEKDETNHWHSATCKHDVVSGLAPHTFNDEGKCTVCDYQKPAPKHEHTYDLDNWVITSTHHWHESNCEHKGLSIDVGEHTYDSNGVCTECGHIKEVEMFKFIFRSDYCDLNNNDVYEEGEEVELSLTLKEAYSSFDLPSEIEVYSDEKLLIEGIDYQYSTENKVGTLSLVVNGDIVVQAFRSSDESAFQVNEEEFNFATDQNNFDYLQYELYYVRYGHSIVLMYDYVVEYCPTIVYKGTADLTAISSSGNLYYNYSYIENEDSVFTEYKYTHVTEGWVKSESNEQDFNDNKAILLTMFPFLGSQFVLTYDKIKDNYNSVSNAYEFEIKADSYDVQFAISFYEGRIINIAYSNDADSGFFASIDLSYQEKDVKIPEEAKPHVHTFSNEWTKDDLYHWHAATCEHTDVKDSYELHNFDKTGSCSVCGYTPDKFYPVVTKVTNLNIHAGTPNVLARTWSDDLSSVISSHEDEYPSGDYIYFDESGNIVEEGLCKNDEFVTDFKNTYTDGLLTQKLSYKKGEVSKKEVYTNNPETKQISSYQLFDVESGVEALKKNVTYEYEEKSRTITTIEYEDAVESDYYLEEWLISEDDGNRKETYWRQHGKEGQSKKIGYLLYNELGQLIEVEDSYYFGGSSYYGYEYITYTEDGNLSSITRIDDLGGRSKEVYTYDENGFMTGQQNFDYNSSSKEFDILTGGYDYEVDDNGTIVKEIGYKMNDNIKETTDTIDYEIKYVPRNFDISYINFVAETKGTYNAAKIKNLALLG